EILRMKDTLNEILSFHTGRDIEKISEDTDRDFFMSSEQALEYGIIDRVVADRSELEDKIDDSSKE
ncbi:MAG: ATP-dependent Clp protease proteolytic subunit, partial [Desulfobacula sp.]|uniref:ATP-dependent Clp protease proteolytic subunit n=1 Tax=Desulfobacula sp. TaxID=2593537 RepID=UPI0025BF6465